MHSRCNIQKDWIHFLCNYLSTAYGWHFIETAFTYRVARTKKR